MFETRVSLGEGRIDQVDQVASYKGRFDTNYITCGMGQPREKVCKTAPKTERASPFLVLNIAIFNLNKLK